MCHHYDLLLFDELYSASLTSVNSSDYSNPIHDLSLDNSDNNSSNISLDIEDVLSTQKCKCGSSTHKRISFKGCPLNKNNIIDTYNIAKTISFSETNVQGTNDTNFRLFIGKMNNVGFHCKALLFPNEKNKKKSTTLKIISNMCCFEGKVVLPEKSQPTELIKHLAK